jgi:hypothetical protein
VHGDRDNDIRAYADADPTTGDGVTEGPSQPALAGVFQLMQRATHRTGKRRTPLQLEEWGGQIGRQADRRPATKLETRVQGWTARGTERFAFPTASGAGGRECQVHGGGRDAGQTPQDGHDPMVA